MWEAEGFGAWVLGLISIYVTLQASFLPVDLSKTGEESEGTSGGLVPAYSGANLEVEPDSSGPLSVWRCPRVEINDLPGLLSSGCITLRKKFLVEIRIGKSCCEFPVL